MSSLSTHIKRLLEDWAPALKDHISSHRADAVIRRKNRESGLLELERQFLSVNGLRISGGPFAGMDYLPEAKGSVLIPKLLGTYEQEIAPWINDIVASSPSRIIDVGCAEGYYAVGLARLLPKSEVFAFDINSSTQRLCRRLAELNGVSDRVRVAGRCAAEDLQRLIGPRTVLVCDIEGGEGILLDTEKCPALRQTTMIVELHDCLVPGVSAVVRSNFVGTHSCETVAALERELAGIPELAAFPLEKRRLMVSEFRVPGQSWLLLRPLTSDL